MSTEDARPFNARCPGCGRESCPLPSFECDWEMPQPQDRDEAEEAFIDAVLDRRVSDEVGALGLSVGDVVQIAKWLSPLASQMAEWRAESAEAEVARLTTLLEQRTAALTRTIDAKNAAEARVARVEALMAHLHTDLIHISDLRAALKGDQ